MIGFGSDRAEQVVGSPQFEHLLLGFESATGLKLHAYTVEAVPLTIPVDPPRFCRLLQGGMECPLFFDPRYHHAVRPELRTTCAGVGHVVVPVIDADGTQLANLVTDPARFGPVDMEAVTDMSVKLRVFPDELAEAGEEISLVEPERIMLAAQALFQAARELASGEVTGARALSQVTRLLAKAEPEDVPGALLTAALEFTGAEFGYVRLLDDYGGIVAEEASLSQHLEWSRVIQGTAEWVIKANKPVDVANVSESAWCRHLAGGTPPAAAICGSPLLAGAKPIGAIVVGGVDLSRRGDWSGALGILTTSGADAIVLARRLLQAGGAMVDPATGAYSLRFLEELLEKEISRAGRHRHNLSVVLFHIANHAELISQLGPEAAESALARLAEMLRGKTRKVNSLARVNDSDFALVIPEAGQEIAEKIAADLSAYMRTTASQELGENGVRIDVVARTLSNPGQVRSLLEELVASPN